jgi:hypothetical protein
MVKALDAVIVDNDEKKSYDENDEMSIPKMDGAPM